MNLLLVYIQSRGGRDMKDVFTSCAECAEWIVKTRLKSALRVGAVFLATLNHSKTPSAPKFKKTLGLKFGNPGTYLEQLKGRWMCSQGVECGLRQPCTGPGWNLIRTTRKRCLPTAMSDVFRFHHSFWTVGKLWGPGEHSEAMWGFWPRKIELIFSLQRVGETQRLTQAGQHLLRIAQNCYSKHCLCWPLWQRKVTHSPQQIRSNKLLLTS